MERTQAIQSLSSSTPFKVQKRGTIHPMRLPVFGFLGLIALGTLLLYIPIANQVPIRLIDALFTATSATCVTGLTVVDTGTQFTPFGLIVLTVLMQMGGLGIMTFSTTLLLVAGAKAGFAQHSVILNSFTQADGQYSPGKILKEIVKFTFLIEGLGAAVFFSRTGHLPFDERLLFSVFHAVSAFCNAGFSTLPDSMMSYRTDWLVNINLMVLIFSGGIGFLTLSEIFAFRFGQKSNHRMSLHSRLNLITALTLVVGGFLIILLLESHHSMEGHSLADKMVSSLFQSISSRTAGFNSMDTSAFSASTLFFVIILMLIGGSPGSSAGGMKTTTTAVLAVLGLNRILGREKIQILKRSIPDDIVDRSTRLFVIAIFVVTAATLILLITESNHLEKISSQGVFLSIFFETVSAFATCGLSMGITPQLSDIGRLIIVVLMFIGRLGPLVLVTAVSKPAQEQPWYAEEQIMVG